MTVRIPTGPVLAQGPDEDPMTFYLRVFVRFLQIVFGTFDRGQYHWDKDDALTEIIIQGESRVTTEVFEKRPAIIVAMGSIANSNVFMDQFAGPLLDGSEFTPNLDTQTGTRRHVDLVSGSVVYNVLSSVEIEARRIAWTAINWTRGLKRSLMKTGVHRICEDFQIGAPSPPGALVQADPTEIILVPVYLPFFFMNSWNVEPTDKTLLKEVTLALTSELQYPAPGAVAVRGAGMHGRPVHYDRTVSLDQSLKVGSQAPRPPRRS